ncbi:MAG TPA: plastocyanin/azurin family copper-binding protein [Tepidiformaceae bacterium]|nr:plastocyanin/azurin family copper-binding protein [Tepidiformaceae bacterium]
MTDERGIAVAMGDSCFGPTILRAEVGDSVTWTNKSTEPHTVTGANASWGDYTEIEAGDSVQRRFDTAGVYAYYCFVHPGMIGAVVVGDGASSGSESSAALQAVQPRTDSAPAALAPVSAQRSQVRERGSWPLLLGGFLGVLGLTAGATVATFGVGRRG